LPQSQSQDDLYSKVLEADKYITDLIMYSNSASLILKKIESEMMNHQLKIFTLKEDVNGRQFSRNQLETFNDGHNNALNKIAVMLGQIY